MTSSRAQCTWCGRHESSISTDHPASGRASSSRTSSSRSRTRWPFSGRPAITAAATIRSPRSNNSPEPLRSDGDPSDIAFDRVDGLCAVGPVVLWMDDAHNADAASLTVLRRLVWASRNLPLVVVITARPFPVREQVDMLVRQVERRAAFAGDGQDVGASEWFSIGRDAGPGPDCGTASSRPRGNPLFVSELLRALESTDATDSGRRRLRRDRDPRPVPAQPVSTRPFANTCEQLDESALDLLAALAVWGTQCRSTTSRRSTYSTADGSACAAGPGHRVRRCPLRQTGRDDRLLARPLPGTALSGPDRAVPAGDPPPGGDVARAGWRAGHPWWPNICCRRRASMRRSDPAVLAALNEAVADSRVYAPEVAADLLGEAETSGVAGESDPGCSSGCRIFFWPAAASPRTSSSGSGSLR